MFVHCKMSCVKLLTRKMETVTHVMKVMLSMVLHAVWLQHKQLMLIVKISRMVTKRNVLNVIRDFILMLLLVYVQLLIQHAKSLILRLVHVSLVIKGMFQKMKSVILILHYQDKTQILIVSNFKAINAHNAIKDTLLPRIMCAHKLMFFARHILKITVTVHRATLITSSPIINVSLLKTFTFHSVKQLVKMVNAHNVKTDTTYQTIYAHQYPYFVMLSTSQLENVLHVLLVTFSKMINVSIQLQVLILAVVTILTPIVHNVNQVTFYKIISAQKLIISVLTLITHKIFVKSVTTQLHKDLIVSENKKYFILIKIFFILIYFLFSFFLLTLYLKFQKYKYH